jgi:hypothetical protein
VKASLPQRTRRNLRDAYRPPQNARRRIALSAFRNALGLLREMNDGESRSLSPRNGRLAADPAIFREKTIFFTWRNSQS